MLAPVDTSDPARAGSGASAPALALAGDQDRCEASKLASADSLGAHSLGRSATHPPTGATIVHSPGDTQRKLLIESGSNTTHCV